LSRPVHECGSWPAPGGTTRVIFLLDAATRLERRLLGDWIERARPDGAGYEVATIPPTRGGRGRRKRAPLDARLEAALATADDPLLAPLRIVWRPQERDGVRAVRLRDLLTFGDPRDPGRLRQPWIVRRRPDRCWVAAGEPALLSELRQRWRQAAGRDVAETVGLAEFVARQAALALERAERRVRGQRYKVPRFVHEEILGRPAFRGGLARLARETGRSEAALAKEAAADLREIAASHDPSVIDLAARLIRWLYGRGYRELRYDRGQLQELYALAQRHPVVFLPSHKSNLDHLVLQYALHQNQFPPNHTAGGINMNFFPVGPIVRRSGVFFIRRSFKDDPVYKFVLRSYVDYLVEKRFPLEWYIEGGRSRSGKLLPPRFGLLAYVVDAYRRGKSEDVVLVPVSIAYDQISDVGDYAAEQMGGAKTRESFGWFLGVVRRLGRSYGDIHLRFGEPLSLAKTLGPPDERAGEPDEDSLAVQKLAFEVAVRIDRVTPVTPVSLVTLALLGSGDRAQSVEETRQALGPLLRTVQARGIPTTGELDLESPDGVKRTLDDLVGNGVVTCFAEGPEAVYAIGPDQHLAAAYYRNTVIHFFVNAAIAELALLRAEDPTTGDPVQRFWDSAMRLRDLLKFEFFFSEKEIFRAELRQELALHDPDWELRVAGGPPEIRALLRRIRPYTAHLVLRPFLEAYRVVADALERRDTGRPLDEAAFLEECLARGRQYRLQRRVASGESVSRVLFATALRLARNRDLVDPASADLSARRRAFADEIREALRAVEAVEALAAGRRAGLFD